MNFFLSVLLISKIWQMWTNARPSLGSVKEEIALILLGLLCSAWWKMLPWECYYTVKHYIYTIHELTKEKNSVLPTFISWMLPSHEKKYIYYTWKPGLILAKSRNGEYEHILRTHIFKSSIYKFKYIKLPQVIFLFD